MRLSPNTVAILRSIIATALSMMLVSHLETAPPTEDAGVNSMDTRDTRPPTAKVGARKAATLALVLQLTFFFFLSNILFFGCCRGVALFALVFVISVACLSLI